MNGKIKSDGTAFDHLPSGLFNSPNPKPQEGEIFDRYDEYSHVW